MTYQPFTCTVVSNEKLSSSFRRITFSAPGFGPAGNIYDLRIKLLISDEPVREGENWHAALSVAQREALRTYSIRHREVIDGVPHIAIDFVDHPGGLASDWAIAAQPGETLVIIGPDDNDDSGMGIEFNPAGAQTAYLFGDETAAPAIARTVEEWPAGLTGKAFIEVAEDDDRLEISDSPCSVHYLIRGDRPRGKLLHEELSSVLNVDAELGDTSYNAENLIWETPAFSISGEELTPADKPGDCYYWIAGESGVVKAMRRVAVKDAGVPRSQVSFMGYWKK